MPKYLDVRTSTSRRTRPIAGRSAAAASSTPCGMVLRGFYPRPPALRAGPDAARTTLIHLEAPLDTVPASALPASLQRRAGRLSAGGALAWRAGWAMILS